MFIHTVDIHSYCGLYIVDIDCIYLCLFILWINIHFVVIYSSYGYILYIYIYVFIQTVDIHSYRGYLFILWI